MPTEKRKHMEGAALDAQSRVAIPVAIRNMFHIAEGDTLLLFADKKRGIALAVPDGPPPEELGLAPDGRSYASTVQVEPEGRLEIPKEVADIFRFKPCQRVLFLADAGQGIAIVKT